MHWIDWCITLIPLAIIVSLAIYARKYIRGVVDYIAVGRVADHGHILFGVKKRREPHSQDRVIVYY